MAEFLIPSSDAGARLDALLLACSLIVFSGWNCMSSKALSAGSGVMSTLGFPSFLEGFGQKISFETWNSDRWISWMPLLVKTESSKSVFQSIIQTSCHGFEGLLAFSQWIGQGLDHMSKTWLRIIDMQFFLWPYLFIAKWLINRYAAKWYWTKAQMKHKCALILLYQQNVPTTISLDLITGNNLAALSVPAAVAAAPADAAHSPAPHRRRWRTSPPYHWPLAH